MNSTPVLCLVTATHAAGQLPDLLLVHVGKLLRHLSVSDKLILEQALVLLRSEVVPRDTAFQVVLNEPLNALGD